jgi:hypothetical protein
MFTGEKILSTLFFRGEVKPSVPCHRFIACKRSLNSVEVVISAKLLDTIPPTVPPFVARIVADVEASGGESWNI